MKDFKVGSEIQIGDRLFEVIDYDDVNDELSHVMLADGTVVDATYEGNYETADYATVHINADSRGTSDELWLSNLKRYGIIPLVEIVSKPIEFVGEVIGGALYPCFVPAGITIRTGMRFKCVEVVD